MTHTARRLLIWGLLLGLAGGVFVAAAIAATGMKGGAATHGEERSVQEGGTLLAGARDFDFIDPALARPMDNPFSQMSWPVLDATCAYLLRYPAGPPPVVKYRLVPEVATKYPTLSRDGKTYTFTIRKGFRFSNGRPVTAANYAHAINRLLDPAIRPRSATGAFRPARPWNLTLDTQPQPAARYVREIVGAAAVQSGKADTASGVRVVGNRLIIRLTTRVPDFPARMTMPYFCPVVTGLPVDPEGVAAPLPGSGPYYVSEFVRGRRVVLSRNTFYRGTRPHHVDRIIVEVGDPAGTGAAKVEAGERDLDPAVGTCCVAEIAAKYGVNKRRFFAIPNPTVFYLAMNTSRALFKDNRKLRQAVSFAIDRPKLTQYTTPFAISKSVTDDYLPPMTPGYRDAHMYPLQHPDLKRARALAHGHTRSGKALMYLCDIGGCPESAKVVQDNLKQIGIDVELKPLPDAVAVGLVATRGNAFDLVFLRHLSLYVDPAQTVDHLFDGRAIRATGNTNISYFDSPHYNRLIERAGRLSGSARYAAYGKLAADLARNAAPLAAYARRYDRFFVSSRVGCVRAAAHGGYDLAAFCLK